MEGLLTMSDDDAITDELSEKIYAYVMREAGHHDVPLSSEEEAMVRALLATDPAARALADDFRDVDSRLKGLFEALGKIPMSKALTTFIHEYAALKEKGHDREAADLLAEFNERKQRRRGTT